MLAKVFSCTTVGMEPHYIEVEVDVAGGLPDFAIVGLPDTAVKESKERVRTAIKNSGFEFPPRKIIVNLAPADIKKEGTGFDLPIAVGILTATEQIKVTCLNNFVLVGELSLDGRLRPIPGVLPMAVFLSQDKNKYFIVPEDNSKEASLITLDAYAHKSLKDTAHFLVNPRTREPLKKADIEEYLGRDWKAVQDLAEVKGQDMAKKALEVAAAGGHNILLVGSPGSGKSMLARCLPSILPPLTAQEALEVSKIYSVAGLLNQELPLVTTRPFRSPHHSSSQASLIGGGHIPRPGEVTLATHGVLFLDELPEYKRDVLESLRQPLEDMVVTISRVSAVMQYPARFQLAAAANPCYCGYYGDGSRECTCTPLQVNKYRNKLSGPLLDRIDIHVEVPRVTFQELDSSKKSETSMEIRERVIMARNKQLKRLSDSEITCNAHMTSKEVRRYCRLGSDAKDLLEKAFSVLGLSARAHDKILKLSRTIADLQGSADIQKNHIAEAIQYRSFDKRIH